ncbi:MAG: carbohydrate-binding family 9-like protein, partial [Planctomycetota bacterium]|nr:carbohydrate-binding family 9-like protein [Planctomycetota bacterium]
MRRLPPANFVSVSIVLLTLGCAASGFSQDDIRELRLRDWQPKSMLVTKQTAVETPRYPVIDIHNHLGGGAEYLTPDRVAKYLGEMDSAGVRTVVNLDGGSGDRLKETLAALDEAHPGRFLTFALVDFNGIDDDDWTEREVKRLTESFRLGAKGLKFHKSLGLRFRYKSGKLVPVDDPKLDPIWSLCGKLGKPIVIHVSDPAAFFTPLDRFNERWHELNQHPDWLFFGDQYPKRQDILDQLHRVIARHPETTFVSTHFGNNAEDLAAVAKKLDEFPNMMIDFDARISELGRQPFTARRFFLKYQDRILFGTDTTPRREAFRIYYRFLETDDEYFDCSASHHLQGFWMIYGINLPDEVLEKIYYKNAERLLGLTPATKTPADDTLTVKLTLDFDVTGDGSNAAWNRTEWQSLPRRSNSGHDYTARIKLLYSANGLYVLYEGTDAKLSATLNADFTKLWEEDVFEFFVWPDESQPAYFEYEISPLGFELPILVSQRNGKMFRWQPWSAVDDVPRGIQKKTAVTGGKKESGAKAAGWSAEIFMPYALLEPLGNSVPSRGTKWRANFYRVDYDGGRATSWSWRPVGGSF